MATKSLSYTNQNAQGIISGTVWTITPALIDFSLTTPNSNPSILTYPDYYDYFSANGAGLTAVNVDVSMSDSVCTVSALTKTIYFGCKLNGVNIATTATAQTSGTVIYTATATGSPAYPKYTWTMSPSSGSGFTTNPSSGSETTASTYELTIANGYEYSINDNGGTPYTLSVMAKDYGNNSATTTPCNAQSSTLTFYVKAPASCTLTASIDPII